MRVAAIIYKSVKLKLEKVEKVLKTKAQENKTENSIHFSPQFSALLFDSKQTNFPA